MNIQISYLELDSVFSYGGRNNLPLDFSTLSEDLTLAIVPLAVEAGIIETAQHGIYYEKIDSFTGEEVPECRGLYFTEQGMEGTMQDIIDALESDGIEITGYQR